MQLASISYALKKGMAWPDIEVGSYGIWDILVTFYGIWDICRNNNRNATFSIIRIFYGATLFLFFKAFWRRENCRTGSSAALKSQAVSLDIVRPNVESKSLWPGFPWLDADPIIDTQYSTPNMSPQLSPISVFSRALTKSSVSLESLDMRDWHVSMAVKMITTVIRQHSKIQFPLEVRPEPWVAMWGSSLVLK